MKNINFLDETQQCSYKNGYITQEAFACKTCYIEKYGLKPEDFKTPAWIEKCKPVFY